MQSQKTTWLCGSAPLGFVSRVSLCSSGCRFSECWYYRHKPPYPAVCFWNRVCLFPPHQYFFKKYNVGSRGWTQILVLAEKITTFLPSYKLKPSMVLLTGRLREEGGHEFEAILDCIVRRVSHCLKKKKKTKLELLLGPLYFKITSK